MSSTRDLVLKHLLNNQRLTINDLADLVNINPISVRHHINKLEAEGLVNSEEVRHGVGRPRNIYFLTDQGMEQFPTRYLSLSIRLVDKLKESLPKSSVDTIFKTIASELAGQYLEDDELNGLALDQRVEILRKLLSSEGFTVHVENKDGQFHIRETSCPYIHVGQEHPEICLVDETLITTLLATKVNKTHCVLDGDAFCAYITPPIQTADINIME